LTTITLACLIAEDCEQPLEFHIHMFFQVKKDRGPQAKDCYWMILEVSDCGMSQTSPVSVWGDIGYIPEFPRQSFSKMGTPKIVHFGGILAFHFQVQAHIRQ